MLVFVPLVVQFQDLQGSDSEEKKGFSLVLMVVFDPPTSCFPKMGVMKKMLNYGVVCGSPSDCRA